MAQTATFQDGVTGAGTFKDGHMYSDGGGREGTAINGTIGSASVMGGPINYRYILQMGLDEIPDNATVTSGVLTLNVSSAASGSTNTIQAIRSSETDWTEDGSHPTYTAKDGSNNWSAAGGSIDSTVTTTCGTFPTSTGSHDIDITLLVRDAIENRSKVLNIVLKDTIEDSGIAADTFVISSGDNSTTGNRPKLVVKYVEGGGAAGKARATTMRAGGRRSMAKRNRRLFRR